MFLTTHVPIGLALKSAEIELKCLSGWLPFCCPRNGCGSSSNPGKCMIRFWKVALALWAQNVNRTITCDALVGIGLSNYANMGPSFIPLTSFAWLVCNQFCCWLRCFRSLKVSWIKRFSGSCAQFLNECKIILFPRNTIRSRNESALDYFYVQTCDRICLFQFTGSKADYVDWWLTA